MSSSDPVTLAFKSFEAKDGIDETLVPIIFLHGLSSSKKHWDDIPQKIADISKRKVYVCDARNHGDSPYSDYFSIDLNVQDLIYFMDSRNIPKAILVGHSMGGRTSIQAALSKPERVEKIFVEDMNLKRISPAALNAVLFLLNLRKESTQHIPKGLCESEAANFSNEYVIKNIPGESALQGKLVDLRKARVDLRRKPDGSFDLNFNCDVITRIFRDNFDSFFSDPKGQYEGPAYFMYGPSSPLSVENEEDSIRKHFPNAELIGFPGAGHNIHLYFPDEFVALILKNL